jgi:uncharacterized protein YdhG (YjbR/CyaY superfamily)
MSLRPRVWHRHYLPDYEEGMRYRMPSYARGGVVEIAFASQKQYLAIYGLKSEALAAVRDAFAGASIGKGCIRYRRPEQVNLDAVAQLLRATAASEGGICLRGLESQSELANLRALRQCAISRVHRMDFRQIPFGPVKPEALFHPRDALIEPVTVLARSVTAGIGTLIAARDPGRFQPRSLSRAL